MRRLLSVSILILSVFLLSGSFAAAQEPAAAPETEHRQAAPSQHEAPGAQAGNAEHGSKEGEAGEHDKFKYSPAVRWMAKNSALTVKQAYWISIVLNFAIIAGVIFLLAKSKLPTWFRSRTESIQKGMAEAHAASEDARRRLADVESRLARLDADIAELRGASEKEAVAEEERIRVAAEEDVRKVLQAAEQEIDAASRQARRELKTLAATLAVDLAAKKLEIDATTDRLLVRDFVTHLGKDGK